MTTHVSICQKLITVFRRRATKAFPLEFVAILVGGAMKAGTKVFVLWFPEDWWEHFEEFGDSS